jgi:hypothetical protein
MDTGFPLALTNFPRKTILNDSETTFGNRYNRQLRNQGRLIEDHGPHRCRSQCGADSTTRSTVNGELFCNDPKGRLPLNFPARLGLKIHGVDRDVEAASTEQIRDALLGAHRFAEMAREDLDVFF